MLVQLVLVNTNFSRLGTEFVYIAASIWVLITGSETAEKVTHFTRQFCL